MSDRRVAEIAGVDQQAAVVARLREELAALAASEEQRALLLSIVDGLEAHLGAAVRYRLGAVHVPLLIGHGLTGRAEAAVDLGAVLLALFLGIDLLDDVMDGEPPPYWDEPPPATVMLSAATLLFSVAPAMIGRLDVPDNLARRLQARLSRCLLVMADGQQADVDAFGRTATPASSRAIVNAKSGEMLAAFAEMAVDRVTAEAGRPARASDAARRYGHCLGQARQLGSDLFDLLDPAGGADVRNALPTLPIAHQLAGLDESAREAFVALLSQAGDDPAARRRLRNELVEGGGLSAALVEAELACVEAQTAVGDLGLDPDGVAARGLAELIDDASVLANLAGFDPTTYDNQPTETHR